jgi:hypothetical protein
MPSAAGGITSESGRPVTPCDTAPVRHGSRPGDCRGLLAWSAGAPVRGWRGAVRGCRRDRALFVATPELPASFATSYRRAPVADPGCAGGAAMREALTLRWGTAAPGAPGGRRCQCCHGGSAIRHRDPAAARRAARGPRTAPGRDRPGHRDAHRAARNRHRGVHSYDCGLTLSLTTFG